MYVVVYNYRVKRTLIRIENRQYRLTRCQHPPTTNALLNTNFLHNIKAAATLVQLLKAAATLVQLLKAAATLVQ